MTFTRIRTHCNNGNTCVKGPCMLESLHTTMSCKSVFIGALSGSIVCASTGQYARREAAVGSKHGCRHASYMVAAERNL